MKLTSGIILTLILFFSFQNGKEKISRMNETSSTAEIVKTDVLTTEINDTIPDKTLRVYKDSNDFPVKYSRDITTGVCIDGECRLVKINLFWNATGRYLGFELPENEFLSKTEHDPFNEQEYSQLHELLSDANSPLASYTIEELVPEKADSANAVIDAMTSATVDAVLDHIVEGAVYTTYTLWHIVYGPTKREIEKLTSKALNADLCLTLLNCNNITDQVWVLNHISGDMEMTVDLQNKLFEFISGSDIYLAERALNALKPAMIDADTQIQLAKIFQTSGFLQKRLIIQKFKESDNLQAEVVQILSSELNNLNGTLVKNILEVYAIHAINDSYTIAEVSKLLKNPNQFISKQAFAYLENIDNLDSRTLKAVKKYRKSNS